MPIEAKDPTLELFQAIVARPVVPTPGVLHKNDVANYVQLAHPYYMEHHRYYHDWTHIVEGAKLALTLQEETPEFDLNIVQQLAWLFHDSVYVPHDPMMLKMVGANEMLSAQLYITCSKDIKATRRGDGTLVPVTDIILDTVSHTVSTELSKPVLDLDLAGFRAPNLFVRNTELLKKEFNLEESIFDIGQARFLSTFLDREFIYNTDFAREYWESPARENITNYIRKIEFKYSTTILKQ